jgi:hypothetical protein
MCFAPKVTPLSHGISCQLDRISWGRCIYSHCASLGLVGLTRYLLQCFVFTKYNADQDSNEEAETFDAAAALEVVRRLDDGEEASYGVYGELIGDRDDTAEMNHLVKLGDSKACDHVLTEMMRFLLDTLLHCDQPPVEGLARSSEQTVVLDRDGSSQQAEHRGSMMNLASLLQEAFCLLFIEADGAIRATEAVPDSLLLFTLDMKKASMVLAMVTRYLHCAWQECGHVLRPNPHGEIPLLVTFINVRHHAMEELQLKAVSRTPCLHVLLKESIMAEVLALCKARLLQSNSSDLLDATGVKRLQALVSKSDALVNRLKQLIQQIRKKEIQQVKGTA